MEKDFQINEIKIMEGVYMWKPELKTENNSQKKNQNNNIVNISSNTINMKDNEESIGENKYLCHGKDELVQVFEIEFEELGERIQSLFQSNEEMLEFDPHDYDLIQARKENLEIIDKKLDEMTKIQEKMKQICNYHPLVNIDIFEYFGIGKNIKEKKEIKKENNFGNESNLINIDDEDKKDENNNNSITNSEQDNKKEIDNKIVTEIEL